VNTTFTKLSAVVLSVMTLPTTLRSPKSSVPSPVTVIVKLRFGATDVGVGSMLRIFVWSYLTGGGEVVLKRGFLARSEVIEGRECEISAEKSAARIVEAKIELNE